MFYYANRLDKDGNTLLTSYANQKSADKFGGVASAKFVGTHRADFTEDLTALKISEVSEGPIVRSFMRNNGKVEASTSGRYSIWSKIDGKWGPLPFRFDAYGAANTLMKALIPSFESLVVLDNDYYEEEGKEEEAYKPLDMHRL